MSRRGRPRKRRRRQAPDRIDEVSHFAERAGFDLLQTHEMPSNNVTVVFRKRNQDRNRDQVWKAHSGDG
jgi:hypothetical protein